MLAALVVSAAAPAAAAERRFTITAFDRIQVDGPFSVAVTTGRSSSAVAIGSPQALDSVSMEVQGRTLRIRPNRSAWGSSSGSGAGPMKIDVTTHELRGASASGSGSIAIDEAGGLKFDVTLAGSGRIDVASVDADNLSIGLMGSGKISLAGKAKELTATVKGSGDLDAGALTAEEAKINADTAGAISLGVRRAAEITATGQGDTTIIGNPSCDVKALGSGRVACGS